MSRHSIENREFSPDPSTGAVQYTHVPAADIGRGDGEDEVGLFHLRRTLKAAYDGLNPQLPEELARLVARLR